MAFPKQVFIIGLFVFLMVPQAVFGNAIVKISIGTFRVLQRIKCDVFSRCDYKFIICIDGILSSNRVDYCQYKRITTRIYNYDPIYLAREVGNYISIPIKPWNGGIHLKIQVLDHDEVSNSDHVDFLHTTYRGPVGKTYYTTMSSRTSIPVSFSSSCSDEYYGPTCDTFCSPTRNLYSGYSCNKLNGDKICLPGFTGKFCNIKIPQTTTSTTPTTTTTTTPTTTTTTTTPTTTTTTPTTTTTTITMPATIIINDTEATSVKHAINNATISFTNFSSLLTTGLNADYKLENTSSDFMSTLPGWLTDHNSGNGSHESFPNSNNSLIDPLIMEYNSTTSTVTSKAASFDTALHKRKWICGDILIGITDSEPPCQEDLSAIHLNLQIALLNIGNYTLNVSNNTISKCTWMNMPGIWVQYCLHTIKNDTDVLDWLKQELLNNKGNWLIIPMGDCAVSHKLTESASFSTTLWAVTGSVIATVFGIVLIIMIVNKIRKQRSEDIIRYDFAYKFKKQDQLEAAPITEDLINILDE